MTVKNWRGDELMLLVENGLNVSLDAIALEALNRAKPNTNVDTGFMRNSGYAVGPNINTYQAAVADAESVSDSSRDKLIGQQSVGEKGALFGYSAEYALHQETLNPTLVPAMESMARDVQGILLKEIDL